MPAPDVLTFPTEVSVRCVALFKDVVAVAEEGRTGIRVLSLQDVYTEAQEASF